MAFNQEQPAGKVSVIQHTGAKNSSAANERTGSISYNNDMTTYRNIPGNISYVNSFSSSPSNNSWSLNGSSFHTGSRSSSSFHNGLITEACSSISSQSYFQDSSYQGGVSDKEGFATSSSDPYSRFSGMNLGKIAEVSKHIFTFKDLPFTLYVHGSALFHVV